MPPEIGSRRSVPSKTIDTWYYDIKEVEYDTEEYIPSEDAADEGKYREVRTRVVNKKVKVTVQMEKTTVQSSEPPHPLESIKLVISCRELDQKLEGTDIETLRAAMWSMLDKKFEIKWEPYYLVEVLPQRPWSGSVGEGLIFSYKDVYKGTTWDGKNLLKIYRGGSYGNGTKIEPWPGEFKNKAGKVIACIPRNEVNTAALEEFAKRIIILRKKLAEFLAPENIASTLTNLAGFALLPPMEKKQSNDEEDQGSAIDV